MERKTCRILCCFCVLLLVSPLFSGCLSPLRRAGDAAVASSGEKWVLGFAAREIPLPEGGEPLYIAGYKQGAEIEGVRDLPRASALWLDTGGPGILLIGIDCIALSSGTVERIRSALGDFCKETGCAAVNVFATHDHESVDTLGLWGPVGMNGKNEAFMENLVAQAAGAAQEAWTARTQGQLLYGEAEAGDLLRDSREPEIYDTKLRSLRFVPDSGEPGAYLLFLAAHAESMRSDNRLVSRDYPGVTADLIKEKSGYETMFLPGAVGGLVMTRELTSPFDAEENVLLTGSRLSELALSIPEEEEVPLAPKLTFSSREISVPLDNTLFMYYAFLGILDNRICPGRGDTGYDVRTSVSLLTLGDTALALLPGELFPELISGEGLGEGDPEPLEGMAREAGFTRLLAVGLANDELGYVVPPSQFLVDPDLPYIDTIKDETGENHYEETNSAGPAAAGIIAEGLRELIGSLPEDR